MKWYFVESTDARIDFERKNITSDDIELEPVDSEDEDYSSAPADYKITNFPSRLHPRSSTSEMAFPRVLHS